MTKKRTVKGLHHAYREDIGDLKTYRALPLSSLKMIDPFLFLNHHGFQVYPENNKGLPFGPHPHRGFETVTFILEGDISHKDSKGHESIIKAGGIQWMTAGRGLIHSETSSEDFKKHGGPLEILQLWVNLPSNLKMTEPRYSGLQKDELSSHSSDNGQVNVQIVSGEWGGHIGPMQPFIDLAAMILELKARGITKFTIPTERNIFFYVIRGEITVNDTLCKGRTLVEFMNDGDYVEIEAIEESKILLCHAVPLNEPVAAYGPFVMNTKAEIEQAISDYQSGKF